MKLPIPIRDAIKLPKPPQPRPCHFSWQMKLDVCTFQPPCLNPFMTLSFTIFPDYFNSKGKRHAFNESHHTPNGGYRSARILLTLLKDLDSPKIAISRKLQPQESNPLKTLILRSLLDLIDYPVISTIELPSLPSSTKALHILYNHMSSRLILTIYVVLVSIESKPHPPYRF